MEEINIRLDAFEGPLDLLYHLIEKNEIDIYDIPFYTEWDNIWTKPLVDSKYKPENSRLKPVAPALYEGLWSFHKEGRLKMKLGTRINSKGVQKKIMKFWLEN